jgi:hypothetical protein
MLSRGTSTTALPVAVQGTCTSWDCARVRTPSATTTLPYPIAKAIYALDEHEVRGEPGGVAGR